MMSSVEHLASNWLVWGAATCLKSERAFRHDATSILAGADLLEGLTTISTC